MASSRGEALVGLLVRKSDTRIDLVPQIVYTAIVGVVMIAAFLEWTLWIAAFMYCVVKVFRKAEHWTVNVLAIIIGIAFLLLRYA